MFKDEQKLIELIVGKFRVDSQTLKPGDDIFLKLGINSLQALDLLYQVEVEFDVSIQDSQLKDIRTFQNLLDIIRHQELH